MMIHKKHTYLVQNLDFNLHVFNLAASRCIYNKLGYKKNNLSLYRMSVYCWSFVSELETPNTSSPLNPQFQSSQGGEGGLIFNIR